MNRNSQRGAVGTFVVVGAVLAAAALAVLYGARHSLSDQQNPPISSELVAADNKSDNKSDNKDNKSNKDTKDSKDAKTENKSGGNSEQKTETGKDQNADSKSGSDNSPLISGSDTKTESKSEDKKADTQTVPQTPAAQTSDKDLPKTGPAESAAAILAVGGLTFIVLAYIQSRRVI